MFVWLHMCPQILSQLQYLNVFFASIILLVWTLTSEQLLYSRSYVSTSHGTATTGPCIVSVALRSFTMTFAQPERYSIPISVTWLLHAPKMSDGYLLFLGSETPFVGSIFAVDLRRQMIYQQDPPTAGPSQRPRRWVLPYNKFVERLPENPFMASKQSASTGTLDTLYI